MPSTLNGKADSKTGQRHLHKYVIPNLNEPQAFVLSSTLKFPVHGMEPGTKLTVVDYKVESNRFVAQVIGGSSTYELPFNKIEKPGPRPNFLDVENQELQRLKSKINQAGAINIQIQDRSYVIVDVQTTPGFPKSDFHLIDHNGEPCIYVSHKDGSKAKDFQQYSGLSFKFEPTIHQHEETQQFLFDLANLYPDGVPPRTTVQRLISNNFLSCVAAYGNDFGGSPGINNVCVLAQGNIGFKFDANCYHLTSNHLLYNGETLEGDYAPKFYARYTGDKSFLHYDNGELVHKFNDTRILIFPSGKGKHINI